MSFWCAAMPGYHGLFFMIQKRLWHVVTNDEKTAQVRLGALVACAELLGGVPRAPEAVQLRRHLQSVEAASLVGYASSVFLQVRNNRQIVITSCSTQQDDPLCVVMLQSIPSGLMVKFVSACSP